MKAITTILPLAALASTAAAAWLPSCAWNDCVNSWNPTTCDQSSGWDCVCSNSTAISQINTCVATSCTNATDQEAVYGAIAQLCANAGVTTITHSQEATFSATSGGTLLPTGFGPGGNWNSASWASWASAVSSAIGSAPTNWGPGRTWGSDWTGWGPTGGPGHWGGGPGGPGFGPWGTKASGIACSGTASWYVTCK